MIFKKLFIISVLILLLNVVSDLFAETQSNFTLILSADMPDIANEVTGQFAQLRQVVIETEKKSDSVFFIFGGGSVGPSAMSSFDRGSHIIDILNTLEPDVMGATKREFSYFEDELSLRAYEAAFPIVASNVIDTRNNQTPDGLEQATLVKKGDLTMGFISIVNERLVEEYLLQHIKVLNPKQAVIEQADKLRQAGADFVVLHYSFPFDFVTELLDAQIINIALLSDTRLQEHYAKAASPHPRNLRLEQPGHAIVASFAFDGSLNIKNSELIDLSDFIGHPPTQNQINSYVQRLNRLLDENIGYFAQQTSTRREDVRGKENVFANFVTDSMRAFADTDIALINGGSIRGDRIYNSQSKITQRTISTELPFRSRLRLLRVKGQDFLLAIEQALSKVEDLKGGFPHVSGAQILFDSTKLPGQRVVSIKINNTALSLDDIYTVATTDYLAQGGDGLNALKKAKIVNSSISENPILISDLVLQNIRINGTLNLKAQNRIVDVSATQKEL